MEGLKFFLQVIFCTPTMNGKAFVQKGMFRIKALKPLLVDQTL